MSDAQKTPNSIQPIHHTNNLYPPPEDIYPTAKELPLDNSPIFTKPLLHPSKSEQEKEREKQEQKREMDGNIRPEYYGKTEEKGEHSMPQKKAEQNFSGKEPVNGGILLPSLLFCWQMKVCWAVRVFLGPFGVFSGA